MKRLLADLHHISVFRRRVKTLAALLAAEIPNRAVVLDVGCGDGLIDALLIERRPDIKVQGIDIQVRGHTHIPVNGFNGRRIPLADQSVDTVLFIDVLHHAADPHLLVQEAARVSRRTIIIKDHLCENWFDAAVLRFMDWIGNAPHGVVLPYTYWSRQEWQACFDRLRLVCRRCTTALPLYPAPASLLFGRNLHFLATLTRPPEP